MGIKEYFMLLLLRIALWFFVVPTWIRSSWMSLHWWEGSNSITLLLPAQVLLPASAAGLLPSFYTCWGRWTSLWWERELTGVWGYFVWHVWHLKNKRIDLVSDWALNKLWLWDQACRICRELLVEFTLTRTYFVQSASALASGKSVLDNYDFIFTGSFNNWALNWVQFLDYKVENINLIHWCIRRGTFKQWPLLFFIICKIWGTPLSWWA